MSFPLLLLVSLIAGLVGAMTGMGGGVVLIPALTFFGMDIKRAIAISIVSVIATSSGSASAYVRDHITNLKVGMFLEMFTMLGALAGAGITVAASERPLYLLFGVVLLASWAALWAERGTPWKPVTHQDDLSRWLELEGSYDDRATGEHVGQVTVSIGATEFIPGESYEALFERCDKALYQAKQSGRNCTVGN